MTVIVVTVWQRRWNCMVDVTVCLAFFIHAFFHASLEEHVTIHENYDHVGRRVTRKRHILSNVASPTMQSPLVPRNAIFRRMARLAKRLRTHNYACGDVAP